VAITTASNVSGRSFSQTECGRVVTFAQIDVRDTDDAASGMLAKRLSVALPHFAEPDDGQAKWFWLRKGSYFFHQ
jgi:hypothetical protein